jgi:hypothetical protein
VNVNVPLTGGGNADINIIAVAQSESVCLSPATNAKPRAMFNGDDLKLRAIRANAVYLRPLIYDIILEATGPNGNTCTTHMFVCSPAATGLGCDLFGEIFPPPPGFELFFEDDATAVASPKNCPELQCQASYTLIEGGSPKSKGSSKGKGKGDYR